jgi:hypothetical protein
MKAVITRNIRETIDCGEGIIKTFYIMLGGRKDPETIKEMFITDDNDLFDPMKTFESLNKYNGRIKKSELRSASLSNIKFDLEVIKNILFYSYDLLNDAKSAWRDTFGGDAPEEYFFMARMGYTHWGMCVIELSKLFTDSLNQQFNLFSLLNKIDSYKKIEKKTVEFKNIDAEKYRNLLNEVGEEEILNSLIQVRNKVFAHTDKVVIDESLKVELDYSKLERLQKIAFELLSELNLALFNQALDEYIPNTAVASTFEILNKELK